MLIKHLDALLKYEQEDIHLVKKHYDRVRLLIALVERSGIKVPPHITPWSEATHLAWSLTNTQMLVYRNGSIKVLRHGEIVANLEQSLSEISSLAMYFKD